MTTLTDKITTLEMSIASHNVRRRSLLEQVSTLTSRIKSLERDLEGVKAGVIPKYMNRPY